MNDLRQKIDEIKGKIDPVEFYGRFVPLKKSGNRYSGLCPFHPDTKPSFFVDPETGRWNCFGCGCGGDLIDFLMKKDGLPFWEALRSLGETVGVIILKKMAPAELKELEDSRLSDEIRHKAVAYYLKSLTPERKDRLAAERKWSPETIDRLQIGYADGRLKEHLLKDGNFSKEQCLKAGVLRRGPDNRIQDTFRNRYVFPNNVGGRVVHFTARAIGDGHPKWLHESGEIEFLYNQDAVNNPEVYLAEGVPDAVTAENFGMPAVAIYGKTFKPEWVGKFSRCERVYVGVHLHETGGNELAIRSADALGDKARIVVIPGACDLNDFAQDHSREEFLQLLESAQDGIRFELSLLPPSPDKVEFFQGIKPVLEKLSRMEEPAILGYLDAIYKKFKSTANLTKDDINSYRKAVREYQKQADREAASETLHSEVVWEEPALITPAQDYVGGKAYFTVYLPTRIDGLTHRLPYLLTSDRERIFLDPKNQRELQEHGLRLKDKDQLPADLSRWSIDKAAPNSLPAFLSGEVAVDPAEVFEKIRSLLATYADYPDPRYFTLLPLWCIGTYSFMLFDTYPYLYLAATKRSGKTRTIEVIGPLCFNSITASSVSDAAMYRSIETDRCTFLCDEAEKFSKKNPKDLSERLEIYNSGYKKSGSVRRCVGDNHTPKDFATYSPKLLANIQGLDATAADRTITLRLLRTRKRLPKFMSRVVSPMFQAIRNDLYVLAMTYHREIRDIYTELEQSERLKDREEELWGPILTIAEFIDGYRLEKDPSIPPEDLFYTQMFSLALDCQQRKLEDEEEENPDIQILAGVIEFMKTEAWDEPGELYSSDDLIDFLQATLGWEKLTKHFVGRILKKLQIIRGKEDKEYSRHSEGALLRYRLRRPVIADIATRYGLGESVAGFLDENQTAAEKPAESLQSEHVGEQDFLDMLDAPAGI